MNLKLTDKTALVSGSTKGIGFAIATGLAREGARVVVNGRSEKGVAEAKQHITQAVPDARIEGFAGDLSTAAATETLLQRFPFVDILVNNLGIFEPKPFEDIMAGPIRRGVCQWGRRLPAMQVLFSELDWSTRDQRQKHKPHCAARCGVLITLKLPCNGDVGFIDWLDGTTPAL
jgi:NAD(P)-dependent dehydrogenase (short-subunit alcohol dehydrogenase family)